MQALSQKYPSLTRIRWDLNHPENAIKPLTLGIEQDHIRRAISLPPSAEKEQGELVILEHIRGM